MEQVTVSTLELLEIVKKNKEKHDIILKDAIEGFWAKGTKALEDHLKKVQAREKEEPVYVSVPFPVSYSKEYDQAIKALEMSVESRVVLSKTEFAQLVMNEWGWRSQFLASNSCYVTGAAAISGLKTF